MIPIYKQEEMDGLTSVLNNTSIAYLCPHAKDNSISNIIDVKSLTERAIALSKSENFGLYCLDSVLASCGWNGNDDVFVPDQAWNARATPVDKPVNYMHDEKDIIGHMTAAIVVDKQSKVVANDTKLEEIPQDFDIVVAAVLYTEWSDEKLQARMDTLLKEIPEGKWFVSMECIFNDFDYAVITPQGEHKTIARTKDTAFLTKHLRAYGGSGEYQGYKLGRQLKNFAFIGKGIVDNPANKNSVILTTESFVSKASLSSFPETKVNKMDEKFALELQTALADIKASVGEIKSGAVKSVADETAKIIADLRAELEGAKAAVTKLEADLKVANDSVAKKEEEAKATATQLVTEKRLAKAAGKGLKAEDAKTLVTTWVSASEDQFDSVLALTKVEAKATAEQVLESVQAGNEPNLNTPPEPESQVRAKASEWLAKFHAKDKK